MSTINPSAIGYQARPYTQLAEPPELLMSVANEPDTYMLPSRATQSDIIQMARQIAYNRLKQSKQMKMPIDFYNHFVGLMIEAPVEEFWVCYMNHAHVTISTNQYSVGTKTATIVDPAEVVRDAILLRATAIAVAHNHPSGNKKISNEDQKLTRKLEQACELFGIRLLDHIIITADTYVSLREEGIIT